MAGLGGGNGSARAGFRGLRSNRRAGSFDSAAAGMTTKMIRVAASNPVACSFRFLNFCFEVGQVVLGDGALPG